MRAAKMSIKIYETFLQRALVVHDSYINVQWLSSEVLREGDVLEFYSFSLAESGTCH